MTVRLLRARLREVWPNVRGETVLGLGYATPFLRPFIEEAAADHGLHAGPAGRHALAARGPQPHHPGRRDGPAAARPLGRPRAAGPCRRMHRAGAADAARDLAGDGRWRPPDRRGADARRPVVADRPLALLSGPSLLARPARGPAARQHVRADAPDPRALHAADPLAADDAHGAGRRALRPALARPLRRRQRHRIRQAALCRHRRAHASRRRSPSCGPSCASPARATPTRRATPRMAKRRPPELPHRPSRAFACRCLRA